MIKRENKKRVKSKEIQVVEFCNECGKSVKPSSGLFINRIPDLNDKKTRIQMGKSFPRGDFICYTCYKEISENKTE